MADPEYVAQLSPSCDTGVTPSAPTSTAVGLPTVLLHRVEVRIPPGHAGTTGIALVDGAHSVVPYDAQGVSWLIGDDDLLEYPLERELSSLAALATYNQGSYTHGWQVRLIYTPTSAVGLDVATILVPPFSPADLAALGGSLEGL